MLVLCVWYVMYALCVSVLHVQKSGLKQGPKHLDPLRPCSERGIFKGISKDWHSSVLLSDFAVRNMGIGRKDSRGKA